MLRSEENKEFSYGEFIIDQMIYEYLFKLF
jgi:hypothetical protein